MKLLLDQGVYEVTARFLRAEGHDVVTAASLGASRAADSEILELARRLQRVLVTRDRDFGALVFAKHRGAGVLYLRASFLTFETVHTELRNVLESYSQELLSSTFVVVEPGRHRMRRLPDPPDE